MWFFIDIELGLGSMAITLGIRKFATVHKLRRTQASLRRSGIDYHAEFPGAFSPSPN